MQYSIYIYALPDAFIQSASKCFQGIHLIIVFPGNQAHDLAIASVMLSI